MELAIDFLTSELFLSLVASVAGAAFASFQASEFWKNRLGFLQRRCLLIVASAVAEVYRDYGAGMKAQQKQDPITGKRQSLSVEQKKFLQRTARARILTTAKNRKLVRKVYRTDAELDAAINDAVREAKENTRAEPLI